MKHFTAPSIEELQPNFPNHHIQSFIAQGGMGAVYLANQVSLDRPVAIKILPREFGADAEYRLSFETEAKAMARLNHSNLVAIYDFGDVDGMLYIIMEYIPGRSLYIVANGQAVEQMEAANLIAEMCRGLGHAHTAGLLHRDIKPANVLIDDDAQPKIVDFGLVRPMGEFQTEGEVFGTPGYTAPEVLNDPLKVDQRSDIYSMGVMLYELLTAKLPEEPFVTASEFSQSDKRFDHIIAKAINPDPNQRYHTAGQMAAALDDLMKTFEAVPGGLKMVTAKPAARANPLLTANSQPTTNALANPLIPTKPLIPANSTDSSLSSTNSEEPVTTSLPTAKPVNSAEPVTTSLPTANPANPAKSAKTGLMTAQNSTTSSVAGGNSGAALLNPAIHKSSSGGRTGIIVVLSLMLVGMLTMLAMRGNNDSDGVIEDSASPEKNSKVIVSSSGNIPTEAYSASDDNEGDDIESGDDDSSNVASDGNDQGIGGIARNSNWLFDDSGTDLGSSAIVNGASGYDSSNWKHPDYSSDEWSSGNGILGFGDLHKKKPTTSMGQGSTSDGSNPTTSYLRTTFKVTNVGTVSSVEASVLADDGVIVYLNGIEVHRSNLDPGVIEHSDNALKALGNRAESIYTSFTIDPSYLVEGVNQIAAEVHQVNAISSDLGFDMDLSVE